MQSTSVQRAVQSALWSKMVSCQPPHPSMLSLKACSNWPSFLTCSPRSPCHPTCSLSSNHTPMCVPGFPTPKMPQSASAICHALPGRARHSLVVSLTQHAHSRPPRSNTCSGQRTDQWAPWLPPAPPHPCHSTSAPMVLCTLFTAQKLTGCSARPEVQLAHQSHLTCWLCSHQSPH